MSSDISFTISEFDIRSNRDPLTWYVSLILKVKNIRGIGLRELSIKTGIHRSRLGLLLHSDMNKRSSMLFVELRSILLAVGIDFHLALVVVETMRDLNLLHDRRFETAQILLSHVFNRVPKILLAELDKIEGLDGTEIRSQWSGPLANAIVEKLVKEVEQVISRRDVFSLRSALDV